MYSAFAGIVSMIAWVEPCPSLSAVVIVSSLSAEPTLPLRVDEMTKTS
jgi:hypothetical protein